MEHVKIKMVSGKSGSPDGVKVSFYAKDELYEVPVSLADAFVAEGVAERVDEDVSDAAPADGDAADEKAVEKAPANKAVGKAPANKAK